MTLTPSFITGVVLAGGQARRMGGRDKGLLPFHGRPLVTYGLEALETLADTVLINANRHPEAYRALGYPVIQDESTTFDGPLAGLLSAMRAATTPYVLTVPCDAPLMTGHELARLRVPFGGPHPPALCAAHDGERLHPVFLLAESGLADDLAAYLARGERRVEAWLRRHRLALADYSDRPELFANLNTEEELAALARGITPDRP